MKPGFHARPDATATILLRHGSRRLRVTDLLLALSFHLSNASSIFNIAVLLQRLCSFLQLPAAVLQLLYVILLLYDGALMVVLLTF